MVASKTLSTLLLGAGAAVAFPHAGHHGHCGSKCSTSSGAVAPTGAFPFAPFGHGKPHGTGKPFGTGIPFGTGMPYGTGKPFPTGATGGANKVAATGTAALGTAVSSAPLSTGTATSGSAGNSSGTVDASSVGASSACTFTDADAATSGKADCKNIVLSGITVPAGETLDMTDLADGTTVTFEGTTTFEYEEWEGPLMSFSGSGITIQGAEGHTIDGNGAKWWDGEGSNGGKTKPKFCYLHKLIDSTVTGLNVLNTPVQGFSINGAQNLKVVDISIDNTAGDGDDGGHNTDAFDVGSSTGVYISGANIQNQDDCLAINSGTDISFTGGTCSGGHGISIGSVGGRDDNDVANVYISDNSITDSDNGVRIKTVSDATGSVKNVTYSNIKLSNIAKRGIVIEQDYENGSPTGTPTDGVPITDLTIENVTGTVASDADNILILCAACTGWTWTGVLITGGETGDCVGVPSGASC